MSIGAMLCTDEGLSTNHFYHLIKADGRTVKEGAEKVHGIPVRATALYGVPERRILGLLLDMLSTSPFDEELKVVTFGKFDLTVLGSVFSRFAMSEGKPPNTYDRRLLHRPYVRYIDLQSPVLQTACRLPSKFENSSEYAWPTLDEACEIILGQERRTGEHDAWDDMLRLKALYYECVRRGFIKWKA